MTPSHVAFCRDQRLYGDDAKNQVSINPTNSVFDVKRLIGRDFTDETVQKDIKLWSFTVVNKAGKPSIQVNWNNETKNFWPEEISAMILSKMKEIAEKYLGHEVKKAVITVPSYFNELQRHATKVAGRISDLQVIGMISEPTAAALAYGLDNKYSAEKNFLVYDLGGGTFDVSIMRVNAGNFNVKSTSGDTHLGGEDFDHLLVEHFIEDFKKRYDKDLHGNLRAIRRLRVACERAKLRLSSNTEAMLEIEEFVDQIDYSAKISRAKFESMCDPLFKKTLKSVESALSDAKLNKDEIDEIVVVGGSTRIPKIKSMLSEYFNCKKINDSLDADQSVAYGAAVHGKLTQKVIKIHIFPAAVLTSRHNYSCCDDKLL